MSCAHNSCLYLSRKFATTSVCAQGTRVCVRVYVVGVCAYMNVYIYMYIKKKKWLQMTLGRLGQFDEYHCVEGLHKVLSKDK